MKTLLKKIAQYDKRIFWHFVDFIQLTSVIHSFGISMLGNKVSVENQTTGNLLTIYFDYFIYQF